MSDSEIVKKSIESFCKERLQSSKTFGQRMNNFIDKIGIEEAEKFLNEGLSLLDKCLLKKDSK